MGLLQLFVTILFLFTYTMAASKHGQLKVNKDGKKVTVSTLLTTMLFVHALYFWGGFYKTFGLPQATLLGWDMLLSGYAAATIDKTRYYSAPRSIFDAILTFACLYGGGFYTTGIPPFDKWPW